MTIKELESSIKKLELELQEAKLKLEIEKVKKTKVEEIIIKRQYIQQPYYQSHWPTWTWNSGITNVNGVGVTLTNTTAKALIN